MAAKAAPAKSRSCWGELAASGSVQQLSSLRVLRRAGAGGKVAFYSSATRVTCVLSGAGKRSLERDLTACPKRCQR